MNAGERLREAAMAALASLDGLGVYDGPPIQASPPYAVVDAGLESDWSHKSGEGREIRLAVTLFDKGERPIRLRLLAGAAREALAGIAGDVGGWRVVTMLYLRSRTVRERQGGWAAVIEFRARMLAG